jgi:hypothetical protein
MNRTTFRGTIRPAVVIAAYRLAKPAPMPEVGPVIRATGRGIRG